MKVQIYRNNRNENKYIEVHKDKCYHNWARQYMEWKGAGIKNLLGDGRFHQYRKRDIDNILVDYELIRTTETSINYPARRKQYPKGSVYCVEDAVVNWRLSSKRKVAQMIADNKKNGISIHKIYVTDNNGKVLNSFTEEEWKKFKR